MKTQSNFHKWLFLYLPVVLMFCVLGSGCKKNLTGLESNEPDMVIDKDGNVYQIIKIGNQWWMAENLKVTHYRNGDAIPEVTDNSEWVDLTSGAYCAYDNDTSNVDTYGYLYNWYAVIDSRNISPAGWHVPTDEEWKELEMYLGMSQSEADNVEWRGTDEGGKLKSTDTTLWESNAYGGATNESGFSALPGGLRYDDFFPLISGNFDYMGSYAYFWSSTESNSYAAYARLLCFFASDIGRGGSHFGKRNGVSVRLVWNN